MAYTMSIRIVRTVIVNRHLLVIFAEQSRE